MLRSAATRALRRVARPGVRSFGAALHEPSAVRTGHGGPTIAADAAEALAVAEARGALRHDSHVFIHGCACTPSALAAAFVDKVMDHKLRGINVSHIHTEGPAPWLDAKVADHIRVKNLFTGANARTAIAEGRADYVPVFLSEIPLLYSAGRLPVDVALVSVSPPDAHGYCSLGPSVDVAVSALRAARVVVAQLNPQIPRTHGDGVIHISQIDAAYLSSTAPHAMPKRAVHTLDGAKVAGGAAPSEDTVEQRIGEIIAESLIPDGATLQLGIGGIPDAVCTALSGHRDIGIHSEMISDGILPLVQSGVITGARKTTHAGKIVSSFAYGSPALYNFLHDNPGILMREVSYTNDAAVVAQQSRMVAINSALSIDLTGQVCADTVSQGPGKPPRVYSGVGGQVDFMRGAGLSPGGVPILALPSTASKGSRIVPTLDPGLGVVTTRAHVRYVVTEFGIADLWGRSLRERAAALIKVSHPAHRDELTAAAKHLGFA